MQRYLKGQSVKDLDRFLDDLPKTLGYAPLIAAGVVWLFAGGAVMFASMEAKEMSQLRAELLEVEALKPPVPELSYVPVAQSSLEKVIDGMTKLYPGVTTIATGIGTVKVTGSTVYHYPQFWAAVGHVRNGGRSWRTEFKTLCFGRECSGSPLSAELKVDSIRITNAKIEDNTGSGEGKLPGAFGK